MTKREYILAHPSLKPIELIKQAAKANITLSTAYIYAVRSGAAVPISKQPRKREARDKLSDFCLLALQLGLDRAQIALDQLQRQHPDKVMH